MRWVNELLYDFKILAIILAILLVFLFWISVPEDEINETEHQPKVIQNESKTTP